MLRRVVGTPYARTGVDEMRRSELNYTLSGEYGWFEPSVADDVIDEAVDRGLLHEGDGGLRADFEVDRVEALDGSASPDPDALLSDGVFDGILTALEDEGYDRREAVARVNRQHARLGDVDVEAAALLVARREGLDVEGHVDDVLHGLRTG